MGRVTVEHLANAEELLGADEVAIYLGVRPTTIYGWCRGGYFPCTKIGKTWRIRRSALDEFVERGQRRRTLVGQLSSFLVVPDFVLAVAGSHNLLHRLDAAFFGVGDARGGLLVKFYGGEPEVTEDDLRVAFASYGLDVERLEVEGRLAFRREVEPLSVRAEALQQFLNENGRRDQSIWASFNWTRQITPDVALRQQTALSMMTGSERLVVTTAVIEEVADNWSPEWRRRLERLHGALIELSDKSLALSRRTALPPE